MSTLNESAAATRRANRAGFGSSISWASHLVSEGWARTVQDRTGLAWSKVTQIFRAHPDRASQWSDEL